MTNLRVRRTSVVALLAVVAGLAPGCSWIAVTAPPRWEEPQDAHDESCTESNTAPIADTVVASVGGLSVLGAVPIFIGDAQGHGMFQGLASLVIGLPMVVGGLLLAIPYGLSADYGFTTTAQCRARVASPAAGGDHINTFGQLGDGTITDRDTPVAVAPR